MQRLEHPSPGPVFEDIEKAWRVRCETARKRYKMARERYRELLEAKPEGLTPRQDDPLALARHAESEALEEYRRVLDVFAELTRRGRVPGRAGGEMTDSGRA